MQLVIVRLAGNAIWQRAFEAILNRPDIGCVIVGNSRAAQARRGRPRSNGNPMDPEVDRILALPNVQNLFADNIASRHGAPASLALNSESEESNED